MSDLSSESRKQSDVHQEAVRGVSGGRDVKIGNITQITNIYNETVPPPSKSEKIKPIPEPPPWIIQHLQLKKLSVIVERPEDMEKIVNALLNKQRNPVENIIALWGPGGFGKTILALLTCCNIRIIQYFTGGIFWVDLEDGISILEKMKKLYKQVTDSNFLSDDPNYLATELYNKWSNEPCLIVLDGAIKEEQIATFYSSNSESCTWLITTRIHNIFTQHTSIEIPISYLRPQESTVLLFNELKQKGEVDLIKVKELVNQLYEWPLLINLVGNKILKDISPYNSLDDALKSMLEDIKDEGWMLFENEIRERLAINFKSLEKSNNKARESFYELLIFPENELIPLSILEKLWNLKYSKVKNLCGELYGLSLLKRFYPSKRQIRLNSYLRQYLKQIEEIQEQLPAIHKKLLNSYHEAYNIQLTDELTDEFINVISNEDEKNYWKRFYKYHWERANF